MKFNIFVLCLIVMIFCHDSKGHIATLSKMDGPKLQQSISNFEDNDKSIQAASKELSVFDIRIDALPDECKTATPPRNCAEATACTKRAGIYEILLETYSAEPILVECKDGGWTVIQRRLDGSVDFFRNWTEYRNGFGILGKEFFVGLEKLHALTNYRRPQELLIVFKMNNELKQAKYSDFIVGSESESYALKQLGSYSGSAGDSLTANVGAKFTTKDHNNDVYDGSAAEAFEGAWWFNELHTSHLNGKYDDTSFGNGIVWYSYRGYDTSIQHVTMMIRSRPIANLNIYMHKNILHKFSFFNLFLFAYNRLF